MRLSKRAISKRLERFVFFFSHPSVSGGSGNVPTQRLGRFCSLSVGLFDHIHSRTLSLGLLLYSVSGDCIDNSFSALIYFLLFLLLRLGHDSQRASRWSFRLLPLRRGLGWLMAVITTGMKPAPNNTIYMV